MTDALSITSPILKQTKTIDTFGLITDPTQDCSLPVVS